MMSSYSDIVKQGWLKTKSQKLGSWQKRWVVLRCASSKGPNRLERYESDKAARLSHDPKVINLTEVVKVEQSRVENCLYVLTLHFSKSQNRKFAASSDMEASAWFDVLNQHIGSGISLMSHILNSPNGQPDPRDIFHVYLLPNTNTAFCGEYLLQVTASSLILYEPHSLVKPVIEWKLNTLRSYGSDEDTFTFEAGRLAQTGEGVFIFTTVNAKQVYQKVNTAAQALVSVQNMNRRRQVDLLPDRGSQSAVRAITHRNSETLPTPEAPTSLLRPVSHSKSLPVSSTKDSNANMMPSQRNQNGTPLTSCLSSAGCNSRPLPPPPPADG